MKFVKFLMAAMVAVAAVGCFTGPEPSDEPTKNVKFAVQLGEVGETTAALTITHTGAETDTWYGFYTTEVKKGDLTLVYEKVSEVNASDLQTGTFKELTLTDLTPDTEYKYVVFGIDATGTLYGTAASTSFTTESGRTMSVNPAWSLEYVGDVEMQDGSVEKNCVSVKSSDENLFYIDFMTKADWDKVSADLYSFAETLSMELKNIIREYNSQYGTDYTVGALLSQGSGVTTMGADAAPGEYVAFMIGMTDNGSLTRLYAVSAPYTVVEQEATPAYTAWFGTYTLTCEGLVFNEEGEAVASTVTYDITLEKYLNNQSYLLSGWDGLTGIPVVAKYDAENDMVVLYGQLAASGVEFSDGTVADIYYAGVGSDNGLYAGNDMGAIYKKEDGSMAIGSYVYDDGTEEGFTFKQITFFGIFEGDDRAYYITDMVTALPATVTPSSAAAAVAPVSKYRKSLMEKLPAPVEYYKVGAAKFNSINF